MFYGYLPKEKLNELKIYTKCDLIIDLAVEYSDTTSNFPEFFRIK